LTLSSPRTKFTICSEEQGNGCSSLPTALDRAEVSIAERRGFISVPTRPSSSAATASIRCVRNTKLPHCLLRPTIRHPISQTSFLACVRSPLSCRRMSLAKR
jgi:hypothetical protein